MLNDFVDYIEKLCRQNKLVAHTESRAAFHRMDFEDYAEHFKFIKNFPAVVLEGSNIGYKENGAEQLFKPRSTAISFLKRVEDVKRPDLVQAVYDDLELLSDQFFVKMKSDSKSKIYKHLTILSYEDVEGGRLSYDEYRILGIRFEFSIVGRMSNDVKREDWDDTID